MTRDGERLALSVLQSVVELPAAWLARLFEERWRGSGAPPMALPSPPLGGQEEEASPRFPSIQSPGAVPHRLGKTVAPRGTSA